MSLRLLKWRIAMIGKVSWLPQCVWILNKALKKKKTLNICIIKANVRRSWGMRLCYHSLTHLHRADSRDRFSHRGGKGREREKKKNSSRRATHPTQSHVASHAPRAPSPFALWSARSKYPTALSGFAASTGQTLAEICWGGTGRKKKKKKRRSPAQKRHKRVFLCSCLSSCVRQGLESLLECRRVLVS